MPVYTPTWVGAIQDFFTLPVSWVKPVLSAQWGWGETVDAPDWRNLRVRFFKADPSLYMNGMLFFSIKFPFFVNLMIRWGGPEASPAYVQAHLGWRPIDGAPVAVLRFQSDASAQGGLVYGWLDGSK